MHLTLFSSELVENLMRAYIIWISGSRSLQILWKIVTTYTSIKWTRNLKTKLRPCWYVPYYHNQLYLLLLFRSCAFQSRTQNASIYVKPTALGHSSGQQVCLKCACARFIFSSACFLLHRHKSFIHWQLISFALTLTSAFKLWIKLFKNNSNPSLWCKDSVPWQTSRMTPPWKYFSLCWPSNTCRALTFSRIRSLWFATKHVFRWAIVVVHWHGSVPIFVC